MAKHTITLIPGDGIGPEVTTATRRIIEAAGVSVTWEECEAGAVVFKKGLSTGVPQETIDSIVRNKIALKGPLETPIGFGEKSANVTLRKMFETYGNIRPIAEMPSVPTPYQGRNIDIIIVRENVEDLYAGIEHMQTPGVAQCLKIISQKGCEKISRLAFEVARAYGRKKVHCATKANIMKLTEGLLKRTFESVAKDYPDIESGHVIIDNCAHQLVKAPEQFDVIVTTNMNGDIISDLGSALIGGLGFAPGANIGDAFAIFEAVHGSAPKYAGKNTINPTAVLLSGVMMLKFLEEFEAAEAIEHALLLTMARDKCFTRDVVGDAKAVTTTAFTDKIIDNLGQKYDAYKAVHNKPLVLPKVSGVADFVKISSRKVVGIDVFVENIHEIDVLGQTAEKACEGLPLELKLISARGVKLYPSTQGLTPDLTDHVCCRFMSTADETLSDDSITALLKKLSATHAWMHVEKLQQFDGKAAYTKTHGES